MPTMQNAAGDVRVVDTSLVGMLERDGFTVVDVVLEADLPAEPDPADLKGQALDDALETAGLPKSGTADEKRARLAEHAEGGTQGDYELA